jgi:hypothetical protein
MKRLGLVALCAMIVVALAIYEATLRGPQPNQSLPPGPANGLYPVAQEPVQYTVLLDVSASRSPQMIAEGKAYIDSLVSNLNFGDRFFIWQMYEEGVNDPESHLDVSLKKSDEITSLEEPEALNAARRRLKSNVDKFFEDAEQKHIMQTDILTTLSIASEQISSERRNVVVLLSDMLQSDSRFEFEHLRRMPSAGWIDAQRQARLIRPLDHVCVLVIGADPSTKEGVVVRDFWEKYFEASNATLRDTNYRTTPPTDLVTCQ